MSEPVITARTETITAQCPHADQAAPAFAFTIDPTDLWPVPLLQLVRRLAVSLAPFASTVTGTVAPSDPLHVRWTGDDLRNTIAPHWRRVVRDEVAHLETCPQPLDHWLLAPT